jgi:uncharacterized iron-regulated membrane protein
MKLLDLLHRWLGGLIGLVLSVLGFSGALLIHKDAWVLLPHASDPQVQDTATVASTVEKIMTDPSARPDMITFAGPDFGLDRLRFANGSGAYVTQQNGPSSGCLIFIIICSRATRAKPSPVSPRLPGCSS